MKSLLEDTQRGVHLKKLIGAIDIGTTQTKGVLYNEQGEELYTIYDNYPLYQEKANRAEQKVADLLKAFKVCLKGLLAQGDVTGIALSCAMHGLIILDKNKQPLTDLITFADTRSDSVIKKMTLKEKETFFQETGAPVHPMLPIYKIKYMRENNEELLQKGKYFVGFKDYLWFLLTGKWWTDRSTASAFGALKINELAYSADILSWVGIKEENLPLLKEMNAKSVAHKSSLFPNLPPVTFYLGGTDGVLANLGLEKMSGKTNQIVFTMGTSGAFRKIIHTLPETLSPKLFCYSMAQDTWLLGGATSNAGSALNWSLETLFSSGDFFKVGEVLQKEFKAHPPVFFPYLLGERAPLWEAGATGSFTGVTFGTQKEDLLYSVILGVLFNCKLILKDMTLLKKPPFLLVNGGFFQEEALCQLSADVLGYPLQSFNAVEASCYGGASLISEDLKLTFSSKDHLGKIFYPQNNSSDTSFKNPYEEAFLIYEKLFKNYQETLPLVEKWQKIWE